MFTSIDEDIFRKAIKEKDYLALKVSTVSTMLDDPTFERGETKKVLDILRKHVPEIFEDEVKLDYEERLEKSSWDKRYFTKLTYWFQENFSESRIKYIEEVGKVVHKDTAQQYNKSMKMNNPVAPKPSSSTVPEITSERNKKTDSGKAVSKARSKDTEKSEKNRENFSIAGAIVAVGALVLVVILLLRLR